MDDDWVYLYTDDINSAPERVRRADLPIDAEWASIKLTDMTGSTDSDGAMREPRVVDVYLRRTK